MLVHDEYPEFAFVKQSLETAEQTEPISTFIRHLFDKELKENLDFVLDMSEYLQKGKHGKL
jgi:hypothetical protein